MACFDSLDLSSFQFVQGRCCRPILQWYRQTQKSFIMRHYQYRMYISLQISLKGHCRKWQRADVFLFIKSKTLSILDKIRIGKIHMEMNEETEHEGNISYDCHFNREGKICSRSHRYFPLIFHRSMPFQTNMAIQQL